jgi:uncharacterized protein YecE (DUF72 family)
MEQANGAAEQSAPILVGTSGFGYRDWVGRVYPPRTPSSRMLLLYAQLFPAVEINSTFYSSQPPENLIGLRPEVAARWVERSGGRLIFVVKAPQVFSHQRRGPKENGKRFLEFLAPLSDAGALGAVLIQFPQSFHAGRAQVAYLRRFRHFLAPHPLVAEFRHRSWIQKEVFEFLRREEIGFVCVDQPRLPALLPPLAVATAPLAYVRFHGRNQEKWYEHEKAWERYDYLYSEEELRQWAPRIRKLAADPGVRKVFVFFNNHSRGQSVDNAQVLIRILDERLGD